MIETYKVESKRIDTATVRPPGSKSITNRALIAAALAGGESLLGAPLRSEDTEAMTECLAGLGVQIEDRGDGLEVRSSGHLRAGGLLDARASGTTARFLTAVATLADGPSVVDGTERMRRRPIGDLVEALVALGADVTATGPGECPPVHVAGGGLPVVRPASTHRSRVSSCPPCCWRPHSPNKP